jgi:tetratricopeptide (TPR) repeat protein
MRRALTIDEKIHGPEHPDVARDLNNLAELLRATNRLPEAALLMRRVVGILERSGATDHLNMATALNNLAQLLQDANQLAEAEQVMRRVLAIDEKNYGTQHPGVAKALNNLASLLDATNPVAWRVGSEAGASRFATCVERFLGSTADDGATDESHKLMSTRAGGAS